MRPVAVVLVLFLSASGAVAAGEVSGDSAKIAAADAVADPDDIAQRKLVELGFLRTKEGEPEVAIAEAFDPVIAYFENKYSHSDKAVYCSRSAAETVLYAGMALEEKREAQILNSTWADAYRLKGYALVDLGRVPEARASIERAVALSPWGAIYQIELGYTYKMDKNWNAALGTYQKAASLSALSPEGVKNEDLAKALHGQGYALTELGRLDEAEAKYRESLTLHADDKLARNELEYIEKLRKKRTP